MKASQRKAGARAPAMHFLLSCLVIGAMLTAPVPAAAQQNKDTQFEEIRSEAQRLMDEIKVPGIAIGIIHDGKVEMAGLGITNITDPQPVTENTLFYIGSISKPFTSTVVQVKNLLS